MKDSNGNDIVWATDKDKEMAEKDMMFFDNIYIEIKDGKAYRINPHIVSLKQVD